MLESSPAQSDQQPVPAERAKSWSTILNISHNMGKAAEAGEWEEVLSQDETRKTLIEAFFSTAVSALESTLVEKGIRQILEIDRRIMDLGREHKQSLMDDMGQFSHKRRAIVAYNTNQR